MSFFRLRDLIRAVRVCKTAADERSVIQRESAAIRTSFKEDNSQDTRYVNIQKLLYIYLLGFPVQFGQLECLKLAASPKFADKRVGYLGVMLLLDEKQDILTLLTNSLKSDMNSPDDYMVGLALCTLSNVASSEVANDLVDEVERLIDSPRSYLRKKAALAAVRIVRREPELSDPFLRRIRSLLGDKHHGVQLAAVSLATEMCNHSQQALEEVRKLVPIIVRQLRTLLGTSSSPEHEVAGIVDPFLQAAILRLLRVVASGSQEAADEVNDVLTQVATQTDGTKNAGTAILYECAVTALAIPSDQSLRVLAINLLGKFLANRDNNVRYVALATLSTAVITEAPSVQRHRNTVIHPGLDDDDLDILGALGKPIERKSPSAESDEASGRPSTSAIIDPSDELPQATPEPSDVVRLLSAIIRSPIVSKSCRHVALTALAKLSGRFAGSPAVVASIRSTLEKHTRSMDTETQARSTEFAKLLSRELDSVRSGVVDRMPVPEYVDVPYEEYVLNPTAMRMKALTIIRKPAIPASDLLGTNAPSEADASAAAAAKAAEANKQSVVSDLLNLMDDGPATASSPAPGPAQSQAKDASLLSDLLGGTSISSTTSSPAIPPSAQQSQTPPANALADAAASADLNKEYEIHNSNGVRITFTPSRKPKLPTVIDLLATFYNEGSEAISGLNFLVAVPKSQKLQILPPSGQSIAAGTSVTQMIRVSNPSKTAIRLRMRLSFSTPSQNHESMFEYSSFPPTIV
ncbi:clathrin associated protein complex large subunit [Dipsacomyces acuminosporus]|nr:clathrin associated protein complex large subunit [Dipsacomyces acuminosporus]